MTFTTGTISRCSGGAHLIIPVTVGAQSRDLHVTLGELQSEPPANVGEARAAILDRLRSAAKEAGAGNWVQLQAAINSKTFQV